jgi:hypothetical protein
MVRTRRPIRRRASCSATRAAEQPRRSLRSMTSAVAAQPEMLTRWFPRSSAGPIVARWPNCECRPSGGGWLMRKSPLGHTHKPVGAEKCVTVSDQGCGNQPTPRPELAGPASIIDHHGLPTRVPDARSRLELAGAARPIRRGQGRRDPGAPTQGLRTATQGLRTAPTQPTPDLATSIRSNRLAEPAQVGWAPSQSAYTTAAPDRPSLSPASSRSSAVPPARVSGNQVASRVREDTTCVNEQLRLRQQALGPER